VILKERKSKMTQFVIAVLRTNGVKLFMTSKPGSYVTNPKDGLRFDKQTQAQGFVNDLYLNHPDCDDIVDIEEHNFNQGKVK
jgi:hypothetical protein